MTRNYITIVIRNLMRHPGYSAINILGLAVGMAACLMIAMCAVNWATTGTTPHLTGCIVSFGNITALGKIRTCT